MTTFITELTPGSGSGPLLAVKDLIDVAGAPTTAGCRAVAESATAAAEDAPCLAGARAAGARIVGKTNLFELAYGSSGVNEWFGTPTNPLDPVRDPGGSSSGSAVAVAIGEADIAYGSDTGGSIRVPAAFSGVCGLKTTAGRVPLKGVWPLAPSCDTVGPMGRDVAALIAGMRLLEPDFTIDVTPARLVGRVRTPGCEADPVIDSAVDMVLARSGIQVVDETLAGWSKAREAHMVLVDSEAVGSNRHLIESPRLRRMLTPLMRQRLGEAGEVGEPEVTRAEAFRARWCADVGALFGRVQLLALPTTPCFAPVLGDTATRRFNALTAPVNLAGLPAASIPVPTGGRLPAGLQLIGPAGSEDLLLATATLLEQAAEQCR